MSTQSFLVDHDRAGRAQSTCLCSIVSICALFLFVGCKERESLEERAQRISKSQSQGLDGTDISVYRVYDYEGDSYHEKKPSQKLVSVDVEFVKPGAGLDLDDVEIVDGSNDEPLASYPDIYLLMSNGEIADQSAWPKEKPDRMRVILIFQVPQDVKLVKLNYWGKEVVSQPIAISGTGPAYKNPPKKN